MLSPATKTGRWNRSGGQSPVDAVVDDAIEEIDREERAEEHDLRRDEEEHPEHRRRDPRAVVDRRRAVVLVRLGCALMRSPPARTGEITWSTGRPVSLRSRSTRSRRSQPLFSPGNVETMISSTRSSWTTCHRRRVRIGVDDLPVRVDPLAAQLGERAAQPAVGVVVLLVSLCGATIRKLPALRGALRGCGRAARPRGRSGSRSTSTFVSSSGSRSTMTCLTGMPLRGALDLLDDVAAHPARPLGAVRRDDDLVDLRLELCERILRPPAPGRSRRRSPAPARPPRAAPSASGRDAGRPRRAACPRRRRSPGSARSPARSR